MPSPYGPGVVGEETFEREQIIDAATRGQMYGPGVIGEEEFEKKMAEREAELAGAAPAEPEETPGGAAPANLSDFEAALAGEQENVAPLLEAELSREDGPRKGALRMLREAESEAGEPRPDVLEMIDDALEAGSGGEDGA